MTWAEALDLVAASLADGTEEVLIERPGLRLYLSRSSEPAPEAEPPTEGLVAVVAPLFGIFYRRPAPDEPPFVEPGTTVDPDTTVAIVEVMKLMNQVTAGTNGTVVAACVEDGSVVEEGQPLFLVRPSGVVA